MSAVDFEDLRRHIGHKIVCVCYGEEGKEPQNVAIECVKMEFENGKPMKLSDDTYEFVVAPLVSEDIMEQTVEEAVEERRQIETAKVEGCEQSYQTPKSRFYDE